MTSPLVITQRFVNWESLPDVSHLLKIHNSYVKAAKGDEIYVAYIVENGSIVAFGSASYFSKEGNNHGKNTTRQLWIEGLVSTVKGHGTVVLKALENTLESVGDSHKVSHKIINIISVDESIGFYENNGYVECRTSSRYRCGHARMAKPIGDFSLESDEVINYDKPYPDDIASFIANGRRKILHDLNIISAAPTNVRPPDFIDYVLANLDTIFNDSVSTDMKSKIIESLELIYDNIDINPHRIYYLIMDGKKKLLENLHVITEIPSNIHHACVAKYILDNSGTVFDPSITLDIRQRVITMLQYGPGY